MICKIERVGIHLFQISFDWNVIPGFGIRFSDGRYYSRRDSQTVEILWEELHPLHMPPPTTESLKKTMQMNLKMSGIFLMSLVVWMANIFV